MCTQYNNQLIDFIIPTQDIFNTVCESYDKTNMFLVGGLRIIILITIYTYIFSHKSLKSYSKYPKIFFMMYILTNVLILLYIISKKQKYEKYDYSHQNVLSDNHNLNT